MQADPGDFVHGADTTESLPGLDASGIGLSGLGADGSSVRRELAMASRQPSREALGPSRLTPLCDGSGAPARRT
jgi:hypothetical protein